MSRAPDPDHILKRQEAYEYHIRRMPTPDIAAKLAITVRQVQRLVKEQKLINVAKMQASGQWEKELSDYIDSQDAIILKGWELLNDDQMKLSSINVSGILNALSAAEERKAKAKGLLIDRTKIDAEVSGKVGILDLVSAAKAQTQK